jgi:hypothetical protein
MRLLTARSAATLSGVTHASHLATRWKVGRSP